MPTTTGPYPPGAPCWVELAAPDQQGALDFYCDLFGWQGRIGPPQTGGYADCSLVGKAAAGIMAAVAAEGQPAPPTAWTTYLATSDVDATVRAVAEAGGRVLVPAMDVLDLGRMAVACDPTGAVFGLWQARKFNGAEIVNQPGALIWSELNTADPQAASAFYSAILGVAAEPMQGAEGYFALKVGDRTVGGMQGLGNLPPGTPSHWLTYFAVDDTDSTVDALVRAGGTVLEPPFDMMAGRMAMVRDPQGGTFAVIRATGPAAAAGPEAD